MKTDQIQHSLVAAADSIASGEISSRELTESCIARIERLQPVLTLIWTQQHLRKHQRRPYVIDLAKRRVAWVGVGLLARRELDETAQ